ncbi:MAG TPA: ABC transporter permease [Candidatus Tectomicrobia bacterium]|nr:ABC transporter permease [Candidatus Tectomicrobia bacterium]
MILRLIGSLGSTAIDWMAGMGRLLVLLVTALVWAFVPPFRLHRVLRQIHFMGWRSLLVVVLTGAFTGMVLGLQGYYTLRKFGATAMLGPAVALSLIREIGPVLCALVVTGRAGSAMAAEIGIMRITDQIDALSVMALNPIKYLISPNILAGLITLPLLTAIVNVVGIYGGYVVGVQLLGVGQGVYFGEMQDIVGFYDIKIGFIKSVSFGLIISWICCYKGFYTSFGAEGVSKATTEAVVMSSVWILICDYFLTSVL